MTEQVTDTEFTRLRESIVTPDVFASAPGPHG
jgi:hypothetical protein